MLGLAQKQLISPRGSSEQLNAAPSCSEQLTVEPVGLLAGPGMGCCFLAQPPAVEVGWSTPVVAEDNS